MTKNPTESYLSMIVKPDTGTISQFLDDFSEEIWDQNYRGEDEETLDDTFWRCAVAISECETDEKRAEVRLNFYKMLQNFRGMLGGRIYANLGRGFAGTSLANCFTGPRGDFDLDSISGIYDHLTKQAQTLKSEGGWGDNFSYIRPRGSLIHGVGVGSPGAVSFMELFDKSSELITSGPGDTEYKAKGLRKKKIRKGAMMGILDCTHPDIEEFIRAKLTPGRLQKFNLSVNCSDDFMDRVVKLEDMSPDHPDYEEINTWNLIFPDTTHPSYKSEWDGNIVKWQGMGYPVDVYKTTTVTALWELIMESTFKRNDPGVLFLDRANYWNALSSYFEHIFATNPCVVGDTEILTRDGFKRIDSCLDREYEVWNGHNWTTVQPKITGYDQKMLKVSFSDGSHLDCTEAHDFYLKGSQGKVEAKDLKIGDTLEPFEFPVLEGGESIDPKVAYTYGVFCNDGSIHNERSDRSIWLYGEKKSLLNELDFTYSTECGNDRIHVRLSDDTWEKDFVPFGWDLQGKLSWLAGLVDSDGNRQRRKPTDNPTLVISSINHSFLMNVKKLCHTLGLDSTLKKSMPDGNGGMKEESYRLMITPYSVYKLRTMGFKPKRVNIESDAIPKRKYYVKVTDIKQIENAPVVYCFTDETRHKGVFNCVSTSQCGEQAMPPGSVCDLGSINMTQHVKRYEDGSIGIDYELLHNTVTNMVRFLDNVNDVSYAPLEEYKTSMLLRRRIGLGPTGWGSALLMLGIPFASDEDAALQEKVMKFIASTAYRTSIALAKEKGPFAYCNKELHANTPFIQLLLKEGALDDRDIQDIRTYGIRNASLLSCQPNGNTGIFANVITGGLEPSFGFEYDRTSIVSTLPDELKGLAPKWWEGELHETDLFKWTKEGTDDMLVGVGPQSGIQYKIDKNRGLCKVTPCVDYGVRWRRDLGIWDETAPYAMTAMSMSANDHVRSLIGFSKYLDSAASKTINVPADYDYEDFKRVYTTCYKSGYVVGATTYRVGTMASVLSVKEENEGDVEEEIIAEHVKMPDHLPAQMSTLRAEGRKWYLTTSFHPDRPDRPFAFFVRTNHPEPTELTTNAVGLLADLAYEKKIPEDHISRLLKKIKSDSNVSKIARMISLLLRHGVLIKNITARIDRTPDMFVGSFLFGINKYLKGYIKDGEVYDAEVCPECGGKLHYKEGCVCCMDCAYTKCG